MAGATNVAWRFPLAFGALLLCLAGLLFQSWRDYGELLEAQRSRLRSEQTIAALAELDRQTVPDVTLSLCVAAGAPVAAPTEPPGAPGWRDALPRLRRLVADNPSQLGRVDALEQALREWQQLYTTPLEEACATGQRLGSAYVQSLFRVAAPTRARIVAVLAALLRTETGLQAEREMSLRAAVGASGKLFALVAGAAVLLGAMTVLAVRGFTAQLASAHRRMRRDAAERGLAQEKMLDAQHRLRMVLEHMADAVIAFDAAGRVQWINPAAELMFCRTRQSVSGQPIALLIPSLADDLDWPVTQPQAELEGLTPSPWSVRRDTVGGRRLGGNGDDGDDGDDGGGEFPLEIAIVQTHVEGDRIGVCLCRDLSEAGHARRSMEDVAARLGDALRPPLARVHDALALLPLLPAGALAAPLRQQLTLAQGHSETALALVDDLLELERLRAGTRPLRIEPLDLASELRAAVRAAQARARRLQVEVLLQGADGPLPVQADAQQLGQVLARLLSRAIDASPAGGAVRVLASAQGDAARVELVDGGPALPPGCADRAFEPFAPLATPEGSGRSGNGLGLAVCRALMERLDGRVGTGPGPAGQGAVFWISLPLRAAGH